MRSTIGLQYTGLTLITLLYSAFITTLLAYVAWNRGIDIVGAPRASAFLHTIPLFSAVLATTILGETIEPYHILGFALILGGVTLAARPSAKQRAAAGSETRGLASFGGSLNRHRQSQVVTRALPALGLLWVPGIIDRLTAV